MSCRLLTLALIGVCVLAAPAQAGYQAPPPAGLPDLEAHPIERPIIEQTSLSGRSVLLLRFDGFVANKLGAGALYLYGDQRFVDDGVPTMARIFQRVYGADPAVDFVDHQLSGTKFIYETTDGHTHWHLYHAARYSLWNQAGTAEVAPNNKVGFCMIDSEQAATAPAASFTYGNGNCGDPHPEATEAYMGLTPGWRDIYTRTLWWQWVDISDVQPGTYRLRTDVDPANFVMEVEETNAPAFVDHAVPGYVAKPVSSGVLPRGATTTIPLASDAVQAAGRTLAAPRYTIEDQPLHGSATLAPDGVSVRYTPNADAPQTDSFTYSVREGSSTFPRSPARATVSVQLPARAPDASPAPVEQVAVSGAPESLRVSTAVQLTANVTNGDAAGVTWSVNGIAGGSDGGGRISSQGLYRAPAEVPPGESVTIRATGRSGRSGEAIVRILPPAARQPAPSALTPLKRLRVRRSAPYVVATFKPRRAGRAKLTISSGSKRLHTCRLAVLKGRPVSCRAKVARVKGRLRVVVRFRDKRGRVTVSRASAAPRRRH